MLMIPLGGTLVYSLEQSKATQLMNLFYQFLEYMTNAKNLLRLAV